MPAQDIIFRLTKGAPLTAAEMDENLRLLRDFANALEALFLTAFNQNGTLKNNSVGTNQLVNRSVTLAKLAFLSSFYAVDTGAVNAYAISFTPPLTAYVEGLVFFVKAASTNTGPATLEVDGIGAVSIKKNVNQDLEAADIPNGAVFEVVHDGSNFQLLSVSQKQATIYRNTDSQLLSTRRGANLEFVHGFTRAPDWMRWVLVCTDVGGDAGYAQNDEVDCHDLELLVENGDTTINDVDVLFTEYANVTNVGVAVTPDTVNPFNLITLVKKDGTAEATLDSTKWKLKVYAGIF